MNAKSLSRHIRLLPLVIVVAGALLADKGVDLIAVARAENAPAADANAGTAPASTNAADNTKADHATKTADTDAANDPIVDDTGDSSSEIDVLTSLAHRRAELDQREKALDMRANLLAAAEKRVDGKIADLTSLENQIKTLLGKRDSAEKAQITDLVKVYSAMKPRDAARIFNSLDQNVLLDVAREMKSDALAAIMAAMRPAEAQDLTVKLANRLNLPAKPDLPSSASPSPASQAANAPPPAPPGQAPAPPQPMSQAQAGAAPPPGG